MDGIRRGLRRQQAIQHRHYKQGVADNSRTAARYSCGSEPAAAAVRSYLTAIGIIKGQTCIDIPFVISFQSQRSRSEYALPAAFRSGGRPDLRFTESTENLGGARLPLRS